VGELMIQETVIPIDFGGGLDTKSDPKKVVAGKFIRLENSVFTRPGQIVKRNGYTATGTTIASVGTLSNPQMTHGYGNELIAADQNLLLSYSSNQDAYISKGNYTSVGLERSLVTENTTANGISDMAILGNYAIYAWADLLGGIYASVVDLSTNTVLKTQLVYSNFGYVEQRIKCACLAGTTLCVAYEKGAGEYGARTVTFAGSGVVTFSAETVITTNARGPFDLIETATGGAFVYTNSAQDVVTATLSTALAVSSATIATTVGLCDVVTISKTSNGNLWVYWTESTDDGAGNLTALTIYYAVYSSALAAVLARTTVVATAAPYYVSNMIAKADSTTQQTLYYGTFKTNQNGAKHELEFSNFITATSAGAVGAATLFANGVIPFSHPFTVGSRIYALFYYRASDITVSTTATLGAPVQPTLFVLELTNFSSIPIVAARFAAGVASTYSGLTFRIPCPINVATFSATKFYVVCGVTVQEIANPSNFVGGQIGVFAYIFDFASADANRPVNNSNVVILSGANPQLYDGGAVTEFGFHLAPEITNLTATGGVGSIADGTYSYIAIFQWIDNQGNLHQSAPSLAVPITLGGGVVHQVAISVTTNFLSQKSNAAVAVFRTTNGGTVYHLVSAITADSANPTTGAVVIFTDILADSSIASNSLAYTFPGSDVLENSTPPPSLVMATHNNRLFFVDAENPDTDVWYTKSNQPLVGVSPSALMLQEYDAQFGKIKALAKMDEKLVLIKESGIIIQSGDGVTDAGQGSSFSFPQIVPSDVGCSYQKSVVLTPEGIMFKGTNGIYMLGRAINTSYIGAEVEQYNAQDVTGATLVPGKSQIRFLTSSGSTLVYDYIFKQWSTFTNHTGTSSTAWNGVYVYATTGGNIFKEAAGSYLDNVTAFALLAQTSWLHLGSVQGFQRVRRLAMLGDYANGNSASHALSVSAAYDFSTTFQTAISYAFGTASSSGAFEYRERLPIQKCAAVSLLIQETTTGSALETVDLTNMSFEAGVKRGVNKLGGLQSVG
jgi:hypothetical protein